MMAFTPCFSFNISIHEGEIFKKHLNHCVNGMALQFKNQILILSFASAVARPPSLSPISLLALQFLILNSSLRLQLAIGLV